MSYTIITPKTKLNTSLFTFSTTVATDKYNGKYVSFKYKNKPILIQSPFLISRGMRLFDTTYSLLLAIDDDQFTLLLSSIDNYITSQLYEKSATWFNKTHSTIDTIKNDLYTPLLRKNGTYLPSINFKLKTDNTTQKPLFSVFNENKEPIEFDTVSSLSSIITKNCKVKVLFNCSSIWYKNQKYGIMLSLRQIQIIRDTVSEKPFSSFMFIEEESENEEEEEKEEETKQI
jgi:hypothetical protein